MKNVHVLPTDKPSRLIFNSFHKSFCYQKEIDGMYINDGKVSGADFWGLQKALNNGFKPQHIYITNDEEIKDCWVLNTHTNEVYFLGLYGIQPIAKKIVLTTDQDLIKDGVQAIDDEFLEWFVKNPSCEWVEIKTKQHFQGDKRKRKNPLNGVYYSYEIIIPKEEPKQETLEEFIQRQLSLDKYQDQESAIKYSILAGAKWQQEQDKNKYSEEDLKQFAFECVANFLSNRENKVEIELVNVISDRNNELFEQFKKK